MLAKTFIKEEKYKLLATLLVAAFFLFFWVNGPLQQTEPILKLEQEPTEYAQPKLVNHEGANNADFGTVGDAEIKGHGNGLVLDADEKPRDTKLIFDPENDVAHSAEFGKKLIDHAQKLAPGKAELKAQCQPFYVELQQESKHEIYIESTGIITDIRGYAGPVNVAVIVDDEGQLVSLHQ